LPPFLTLAPLIFLARRVRRLLGYSSCRACWCCCSLPQRVGAPSATKSIPATADPRVSGWLCSRHGPHWAVLAVGASTAFSASQSHSGLPPIWPRAAGPYDEMKMNKRARFVRIAGWFSPIEKFRPALNPRLGRKLQSLPPCFCFFAGRLPWRYELSMERAGAKSNLVSRYNQSTVSTKWKTLVNRSPGMSLTCPIG